MSEPFAQSNSEPRWGSEDRERKAAAIWMTFLHYAGPEIANGRWLDIGCGSGGIAMHLASRVSEMVGIDPEPWARWADWMQEHPNLKFLQGSYDHEPALIPPASVDVVVCNQVYEHVPDPVALIDFIHLVLKPGGYCYFAGPNLLFPIEPHVFWPFVHWLPRKWAIGLMRVAKAKYLIDANSVTYWQLCQWLNNFERNNALPYVIKHSWRMGRDAWPWHLMAWLPRQFLGWLTPLSPGFIFVLRKPLSLLSG